jgi:hypothetical protein
MIYSIELTFEALKDIEKFKRSGDKKTLVKIDKLFNELRERKTNIVIVNRHNSLMFLSKIVAFYYI